ncbi:MULTISPECIES: DUF6541 family protein [Actinoalloteichus]|uniref:Uncharacterized protein n=1 Tax=Actinoalloteichus fjordicus TaxID=1612552 RepID=A0AAC9PPR5_9PSEU|nr:MULTISPECIES: DUF6541 family protein [Actinoalloteichus]APU12233.1 hypothetical protein UA74_00670 [Actinoalloteichus fjordicus]APU18185.1 hypothetical protein UA75_00670 [Actinoalloteichus sp. GBA129-24]
MSWLEAVPTALIALGWLLAPGLLLAYAAGFRGIPAWGAAPLGSLALIGTIAVAAGAAGITWGPLVVAGGTILASIVAVVIRLLLARRRPAPLATENDPRSVRIAAVVGILLAVPIGAVTVAVGMGSPDRLVQSFDAVFHLNAITFILEDGNASTLAVGGTTDPNGDGGFYPAVFHALAALVEPFTSVGVVTAANITAAVIALIAWPLSCLLLVRVVTGPSMPAMALTGLISMGFASFPWNLLGFGVIWPNLAGLAVLPAGLAAVVALTGLIERVTLGRGQAVLLLLAALAGGGLAHPNSVFSLIALSIAPVAIAILRRARVLMTAKRYVLACAVVIVPLALALTGWAVFRSTAMYAELSSHDWPAYETPAQAFGEVLFGGLAGRSATWLLSAIVIVGLVSAWRSGVHRWLVYSHVITAVLYMFAAALDTDLSMLLTAVWYNDAHRLAAMVPITSVPLALLGLISIATAIRKAAADHQWSSRGAVGRLTSTGGPVTLLLGVLLVILTGGMYARDHPHLIARLYPEGVPDPAMNLVNAEERRFFEEVAAIVPSDATVANQPWDGSALLWATEGRRVLYPHLVFEWSEDQEYLAAHLADVGEDPRACQAVQDQGVEYLIKGSPDYFWPWDSRQANYPGIDNAPESPGFELVAEDGDLQLYRITACAS